jgi:large subunit ribosomal protein L30e
MVDVSRVVQSVVKSGRAFYGAHQSEKAVKAGRAAVLVMSNNSPEEWRKKLERYATLSSIPVIPYPGSSRDLGMACRKPFAVSVLAVREIPEGDLALEVKESVKVQNQI